MFLNIVILLFTVSMASYQVYAATTLDSTAQYEIGDSLVVTATIADAVTTGTFTIKYGPSGSEVDIGTVTVVDNGADTYAAAGGSPPSHVVVATSGSNTETDGKIKVTITLVADDDEKVLLFKYSTGTTEDASFTVELSCPPIVPADNQEVKSSTGTGCTATDYRKKSCQTVFGCAAGFSGADVTSTCTTGAWIPNTLPTCAATACAAIPAPTNGASTCTSGTSAKEDTCAITCNSGYSLTAGTANLTCQDSTDSAGKWSDATEPVCTAVSCEKIPSPANGTSSCAASNTKVGSNCTITCDEGTKLSGSSPVTCETDTGVTGKWSNTTDKYSCDAVSGAGIIALNMMLALVLGTISSFMM